MGARQADPETLTCIRRIALSSSPDLRRSGTFGKREAPPRIVDGCRGGSTPRRAPKHVAFSVIATHLSHRLAMERLYCPSQLTHTLQVLEKLEDAGITDREFLATMLIHDVGKLAAMKGEKWENIE